MSDAGIQEPRDYILANMINCGMKVLEVGCIWMPPPSTAISAIQEFANLAAAADPEIEIWIDSVIDPNYANWDSWWNNYKQLMDALDQYPNITHYGVYYFEYAATPPTAQEEATWMDTIDAEITRRGRIPYWIWGPKYAENKIANRWNKVSYGAFSMFGFGLNPEVRGQWEVPDDLKVIGGMLGMWGYDQGLWWTYALTTNFLKGLDAGWNPLFVATDALGHFPLSEGFTRACRERNFNEYVCPKVGCGQVFASQTELDSHQRLNHAFLTAQIMAPTGSWLTEAQTYTLQVQVRNEGAEAAKDVVATLALSSGNVEERLRVDDVWQKMVGDILPGETRLVEWVFTVRRVIQGNYVAFRVGLTDSARNYDSNYNDAWAYKTYLFTATGTGEPAPIVAEDLEIKAFQGTNEVQVSVDVYQRREKGHWLSQYVGRFTTPFRISRYPVKFLYVTNQVSRTAWANADPFFNWYGQHGLDVRLGVVIHRLDVKSSPISGIAVKIDDVAVDGTPVSKELTDGNHTVSVPQDIVA